MKKLIIASNNEGKSKEIKAFLSELPFHIFSLRDISISIQVDEDQDSFEGNACKKASEIMKATGEIALADDSGLEVAALNDRPGVNSAMFAGQGATDKQNNAKLLEMMRDVPVRQRQAAFCCTIAVAYPDKNIICATERCYGRIALVPTGENGFGYDPLFIADGMDKTFAQLSSEEKNILSHRGLALRKIKILLENSVKG